MKRITFKGRPALVTTSEKSGVEGSCIVFYNTEEYRDKVFKAGEDHPSAPLKSDAIFSEFPVDAFKTLMGVKRK